MRTHRRILSLLAVACVAVPSLLACGSPAPGSSSPSSAGATDDLHEKKFTRTVVVFEKDGSQTVHRSMISRAEQLEEQAVRQANSEAATAGINQVALSLTEQGNTYNDGNPPDCSNLANVNLYDGAGESGNEICFRNTHGSPAVADLATYPRVDGACGYMGSFTEYWYGPIGNPLNCDAEDTANYVASISYPTGGSPPSGCFNKSGGSYGQPNTDYWNFDVAESGATNTGSDILGYEFLWLNHDGDTDDVCYYDGG
jgi:hypothetical protein